jgi:hypothetical protein
MTFLARPVGIVRSHTIQYCLHIQALTLLSQALTLLSHLFRAYAFMHCTCTKQGDQRVAFTLPDLATGLLLTENTSFCELCCADLATSVVHLAVRKHTKHTLIQSPFASLLTWRCAWGRVAEWFCSIILSMVSPLGFRLGFSVM